MAGLVADSVALHAHRIADPRSSDNCLALTGLEGTRMGATCHVIRGGVVLITVLNLSVCHCELDVSTSVSRLGRS